MQNQKVGYLYLLNTVILFSTFEVVSKTLIGKVNPFQMNFIRFFTGGLLLFIFVIFKDKIKISNKDLLWVTIVGVLRLPVISFDYSGIYQVIYLSVLVTGLAYLTYFKGLSIVGASNGSLVFFIKPVLAGIIAIIFLKETATVNLFLGTALIITGIMVVIYWAEFKPRIRDIYNRISGVFIEQ